MGVSKNRGKTPQIMNFNRAFHYFHHPFWGPRIFGNTHINIIFQFKNLSDFPPLLAAPQEHRMASFASTLQLHRRSQPSVIFQLSHVRFVNLARLWFVI